MGGRIRTVIMGAAGRDFHNFNVYFRRNDRYEVVAFTAAQIPGIEHRIYPPELAGPRYPRGIPIHAEEELPKIIEKDDVDLVVLAYSDLSHDEVMHKASAVTAMGPDFWLMGPKATMLRARVPVISVCAVRTGAGKSTVARCVSQLLKQKGRKVVVIRHPMPYGDLARQVCQRFASYEDLEKQECTIEEREEYEPHVQMGNVVYAGIDYERVLRDSQKEADVLLWDGGNNDIPFIKPDLHIVVADPHRPGHEISYYPGETNVRMANAVVINKVDTAPRDNVDLVRKNVRKVNPSAAIIEMASYIRVDDPSFVQDKKVLVVEDGPTVTHGEMRDSVGAIAARHYGAREMVNPRPYAAGSIRKAFEKYPHLGFVLPAMGYGKRQIQELEQTINSADCESIIIGTPIDLRRIMKINKPAVRVMYEARELTKPGLEQLLASL